MEKEQRLADGSPAYVAEAEQQIIGAMMVWLVPEDIDEIIERTGLRSEMFRDYTLGLIWNAIVVSAARQKDHDIPIMPTLVSDLLEKSGKYDEVGGNEFLNRLIGNVSRNFIHTSLEGIIFNINVMKDWVERRKDYQEGQRLVERAFASSEKRKSETRYEGAMQVEVIDAS